MKYLAMGDSFTEGVGDPHPEDDGSGDLCRGWADRLASRWSRTEPDLQYANLAVRGKLLHQVLNEQLEQAVDLAPDVVTCYAGGNDLMRPKADIDKLAEGVGTIISTLQDAGAKVYVFTAVDPQDAPVFKAIRGRSAIYSENIRELAEKTGAGIVDFWRAKEYSDMRMWSSDRLHMNSRGHRFMSQLAGYTVGAQPEIGGVDYESPITDKEFANDTIDRQWVRSFAAPWVSRRLRGTSSGDGRQPKYTEWIPATELDAAYKAAGATD